MCLCNPGRNTPILSSSVVVVVVEYSDTQGFVHKLPTLFILTKETHYFHFQNDFMAHFPTSLGLFAIFIHQQLSG